MTNDEIRLNEVSAAYQEYLRHVENLPYPGCFQFLHSEFIHLANSYFHLPSRPWVNPYELAHIANYVALYGRQDSTPIQFDWVSRSMISRNCGPWRRARINIAQRTTTSLAFSCAGSDCYPLELNSFISTIPGNSFLNQIMYMPNGNTKSYEILRSLSAKQPECKGP